MATAAAHYHPLYYWLVGQVTRVQDGTAALQAMRVVSALLCDALLVVAMWATSLWARSRWPVLALIVSMTPMLIYSTIIVAPNALEIAAAYAVWACLLGVARESVNHETERALLLTSLPAVLVLVTVRQLGVLWLGLILVTISFVMGWRRASHVLRGQARVLAVWTMVTAVGIGGAVVWLKSQVPVGLERTAGSAGYPGALGGTLANAPVWVLQTVAAAPGRHDPAPGLVYLACGLVLTALICAGLRCASIRVRLGLCAVATASIVGPFLVTLHSYSQSGVIWQGRYGMPLSMGALFLAGFALDHGPAAMNGRRLLVYGALCVFAAGQVLEVVHVSRSQARISPSVAAGLWTAPSPWVVGMLMVGAWGALGLVALLKTESSGTRRPARSPAARGTGRRR